MVINPEKADMNKRNVNPLKYISRIFLTLSKIPPAINTGMIVTIFLKEKSKSPFKKKTDWAKTSKKIRQATNK